MEFTEKREFYQTINFRNNFNNKKLISKKPLDTHSMTRNYPPFPHCDEYSK